MRAEIIRQNQNLDWQIMGKLNRPKIEVRYCACGPDCKVVMQPGRKYARGHKPKPIPNHHLCACSNTCDIMIASDKIFAHGHHNKGKQLGPYSAERRQHMSDAKMGLRGEQTNRYGTTTSEQGLENMSAAMLKRIERDGPPFLGHHHTEETKEVLRIKSSNPSEEIREKNRQAHLGKKRTPESVLQGLKTKFGESYEIPELAPPHLCWCGCLEMTNPGCDYIWGHHTRNKERPMEVKEKCRIGVTKSWANYTDEERNTRVLAWAKSQNMHPNKPESGLSSIVENLYPANYKYTGGGDVVIAGKIPDFINVNGQKKIIELYGDYWHRGENPQDRIDIFKPYGYDTLVVWEHELEDVEKLKLRIIEFHERNHHESKTPEELRHG